jgi:tetratricopeptide (TPR) repeat protein
MDRFNLGAHSRPVSTRSVEAQRWFDLGLNWCFGVKTGLPAKNSDVIEALKICDRAIELADGQGKPPHPAIVHLHIHALEMSNEPQWAMRSADALATMCPDAGHMNHVPGHVYMLCGNYQKAKSASEKAIVADDMYLSYAGSLTFYTIACAHDLHLMMYACMFMGRYREAIDTANKTCRLLSREVLSVKNSLKFAMSLEGYHAMKTHVMVRFGRWQEIIDEPLPDDPGLYLVTTAMQHYAKGIAHATLTQFGKADEERSRFYESLKRIPQQRRFFNNPAHAVLSVGAAMLEGEVEYHKGNYDKAFGHLGRLCARMTISNISSPGPGCIRRAMRSRRC